MKYLVLFALALGFVACENEPKQATATLQINLTNSVAEEVVIRGNDFEKKIPIPVGKTMISDTLDIPQDGYYQVYINRERTELYLEKGTNVTMAIDANKFDESITYSQDLARENNYLAKKYLLSETSSMRDTYAASEADFIAEMSAKKTQSDSLLTALGVTNKKFLTLEADAITYTNAAAYTSYQDAHRYYSKDENFVVSETFYDAIKDINVADTVAYRNSQAYQNFVSASINRMVGLEAESDEDYDAGLGFLKKVDETLPDGYAKNKMMEEYLSYMLSPNETLEQSYAIYKNSNPSTSGLAKITAIYDKLKGLKKGNPSPTFDYENYKGGTTSLADLGGKYTYIDVWATWCGPCIAEIPALKQLEKDYHDKNINFVSISIDTKDAYQKWKDMIEARSLGGVQLMADNNWNSDFVKGYGISGIPRFILIDPHGNIVTADATRPSNSKTRKLFDELM